MKTLFLNIAMATTLAFASCGGGGDDKPATKSSACDIVSFKDGANAKEWNINGTTITASYPKGTNLSAIAPVITVSDKATVKPASGATQDFSAGKAVGYTVTAEDGKTKVYTAQATAL